MGVNKIIFGDVDSSDYGILISGEGVWSSPARDVEYVEIPGRDGDLLIDHGRYKEIKVTYPCAIQSVDHAHFRTDIDLFRNAMLSQHGYQRLTDSIHPLEYRMAALTDGLEIKPIMYNDHSATFDISFTCKPQRFQTSGETWYQATGNPPQIALYGSLYDLPAASPALKVKGYGDLHITNSDGGDYHIGIDNIPIGDCVLASAGSMGFPPTGVQKQTDIAIKNELVAAGDPIQWHDLVIGYDFSLGSEPVEITSVTASGMVGHRIVKSGQAVELLLGDAILRPDASFYRAMQYTAGTADNISGTATINYTQNGVSKTKSISYRVQYDGASSVVIKLTGGTNDDGRPYLSWGDMTAVSTATVLDYLYIDCETGLAWWDVNGTVVDATYAVTLPLDLPKTGTGPQGMIRVVGESTMSELYLQARWWII